MEQNMIRVKGLLLTGIDAVWIPCMAIIGAASVVTAAGYGVYTFFSKKSEHKKLVKSVNEFKEYVNSLKEGKLI